MRNFIGHSTWPGLSAELEEYCTPEDVARVKRAWDYAADAHGEQRRPSGEPYVAHLSEAVQVLLHVGITEPTLLIAALLHDVVEDTDRTLDEIRAEFGSEVAELVDWVTKPPTPVGVDKATHKVSYLQRFQEAPADAVTVKLADRYSNVQRLGNHPSVEKRYSYFQETVDNILPLATAHPLFVDLYQTWHKKNQHYASRSLR